MISKTKIKFIKSLQLKKNREQTHLFIAEGHKLVEELLAMSRAHTLVATQEWLANHSAPPADEVIEVTSDELRKVVCCNIHNKCWDYSLSLLLTLMLSTHQPYR